ncbi:MAG TPA: hypothetical protein VNW90_19270 [Acetobacteraceae bacterium]|jgi:hypothetical protein|nr:hypothetical protein [Acetobacteraceae bacterium]
MNIAEAIEAVTEEYNEECYEARDNAEFDIMMRHAIYEEYQQIDQKLPSYVADIAGAHRVPIGTVLPDYVYQMARMCFRLGMRVQRKLDHPELKTTIFWQPGVTQ